MKEIRSIVDTYKRIDFAESRAALATVAGVEGSSYRRAGARMLVLDNGTYLGGISGGCLEGDALRRAQKAIHLNKASVITYDTTQEDGHQIGVGLGCNGIIDVLFTPLDPMDEKNPVRILSGLTETRETKILVTILSCESVVSAAGKCVLFRDEQDFAASFAIPSLAAEVISDIQICRHQKVSKTIVYADSAIKAKVFIEMVHPATHLLIFGGNYDVPCLVRIATELGWETTVVTNSTRARPALLAATTRVLQNGAANMPRIDPYTAVLLMAHDYATDFDNLQQVLASSAFYIGLLGPRKRAEKMFDALLQQGKSMQSAVMERIFAPAGLDIGAATPEEIALSIAAEIRAQLAGRLGMSLRERQGPIYGNEK